MTLVPFVPFVPFGLFVLLVPGRAQAADLDGSQLGAWWALPFAGLLLSIAVLPLLAPRVWHHHVGKITAAWSAAMLLPLAASVGPGLAAGSLVHALVVDYIPFTVVLVALFTAAGGIHVRGNLHGSPAFNTGLMAIGAVLASVMGTTGASMLLIRPLIRANDNRRNAAHVVVFFIFIVGNAGGSLTPLGDPPLFLGFLKGVSFFWTASHILPQTLFLIGSLLGVFYVLDRWLYGNDGVTRPDPTPDDAAFGLDGAINLLPLALVVGLVLLSGTWKSGLSVDIFGTPVALEQGLRDVLLVGVIALSLAITPSGVREANQFSWAPMQEVAKLFAGIFVTVIPVLAMLRAGLAGPFAATVRLVTGPDGQPQPWAYFWLSGILSSFLDNAPTYLVFFNLAGGDPQVLMTTLAPTLAAISAGSVFMGANTYIGNAPNFMVKAIAEDRGVKMPSFFGYMRWSALVLIPLFMVMTLLWFK